MKRRDFIRFLGGGSTALLLVSPARAQTDRLYRVGFLSPGELDPDTIAGRLIEVIARQLARGGFTAGVNLELIKRGALGHSERLPALVAELVTARVDVIVTFSYPVAAAAKQGTSTIPIVAFNAGAPLATHLVASLNRPGGNVTGVSDLAAELTPKRLELLKVAVPRLRTVAMLWNAADLGMTTRYDATVVAAKAMGVTVLSFGPREPGDFDEAFAAMERVKPDGFLMVADALALRNRERVYTFAAEHGLPAIYETDAFVREGGLMSYGPDEDEAAENGANLVLRILKGGKPADLPLEQPTRFRLVINLKTAKALGLNVPRNLLVAADQVIE